MSRSSVLEPTLMVLWVLISATGCARGQVVPVEQLHGEKFTADSVPVAHIYADNWGIYLPKHDDICNAAFSML